MCYDEMIFWILMQFFWERSECKCFTRVKHDKTYHFIWELLVHSGFKIIGRTRKGLYISMARALWIIDSCLIKLSLQNEYWYKLGSNFHRDTVKGFRNSLTWFNKLITRYVIKRRTHFYFLSYILTLAPANGSPRTLVHLNSDSETTQKVSVET